MNKYQIIVYRPALQAETIVTLPKLYARKQEANTAANRIEQALCWKVVADVVPMTKGV